jgi:hypothetical protein
MGQAAVIPIAAAVAAAVAVAGAGALLTPKPLTHRRRSRVKPTPDITEAASQGRRRRIPPRQGAAANMITGPNGVEAPSPGAKALLGQ